MKLFAYKKNYIHVNDLIIEESGKVYSNLKYLDNSLDKTLFITITSTISNMIYDFYLDINRPNNIFYNNIKTLNPKNIRQIYVLSSAYLVINFINDNKVLDDDKTNEICDNIINKYFQVFNLKDKDRRLFYNIHKAYISNPNLCTKIINKFISTKIFNTKVQNPMEVSYINYFLTQMNKNFIESYEEQTCNLKAKNSIYKVS